MFKVGDKVRRKVKYHNGVWTSYCNKLSLSPHEVFTVLYCHDLIGELKIDFGKNGSYWDKEKFEHAQPVKPFSLYKEWL